MKLGDCEAYLTFMIKVKVENKWGKKNGKNRPLIWAEGVFFTKRNDIGEEGVFRQYSDFFLSNVNFGVL